MAREKEHEVILSDNLALPFRDSSMDAVLSIAVIHHIATAERRVHALKELSRVLKVGGRVMISVWAFEQRHRKFESQDVLIPWHKPVLGLLGPGPRETTTATSDDDVTHYHAYTQTSDSDQRPALMPNHRLKISGLRHRRNGKGARKAGRSFDPSASSVLEAGPGFRPPYQSSSELSSPSNETCYSFVRKALQKFSGPTPSLTHAEVLSDDARPSSRFQWFRLAGLEKLASLQLDDELDGLDSASVLHSQNRPAPPGLVGPVVRGDSGDSSHSSVGDIPIELPQLEAEDGLYHVFKSNLDEPPRPIKARRSRSLGDTEMLLSDNARPTLEAWRQKRQALKETRRAMTCDDSEPDMPTKGPKLIKDIISASLASLRPSRPRSGSITSMSSGKSLVSNFSVKSDSGISLPRPTLSEGLQHRPVLPEGLPRPTLPEEHSGSNNMRRLGKRNWDSEPVLSGVGPSRKAQAEKACLGEKEKSRAMQSVESKLMKAIKEVNESDISENNTPLNSPGPAGIFQAQKALKVTSPLVLQGGPESESNTKFALFEASNEPEKPAATKICFEELKAKIKEMPKFRPTRPESINKKLGPKQMSLHDELLSHERLEANEEMRKKIQKQQSLPDNGSHAHKKGLKEGLMEIMGKSGQLESLKQSLVLLRNKSSVVVEEREENLTPKEKTSFAGPSIRPGQEETGGKTVPISGERN